MRKIEFYSAVMRDGKKTVEMQNGYTDGEFNYYRAGRAHWYCIDPKTGFSVTTGTSKEKAQLNAKNVIDKFEALKERETYKKMCKEFDELRLYGGGVTFAI